MRGNMMRAVIPYSPLLSALFNNTDTNKQVIPLFWGKSTYLQIGIHLYFNEKNFFIEIYMNKTYSRYMTRICNFKN